MPSNASLQKKDLRFYGEVLLLSGNTGMSKSYLEHLHSALVNSLGTMSVGQGPSKAAGVDAPIKCYPGGHASRESLIFPWDNLSSKCITFTHAPLDSMSIHTVGALSKKLSEE